MDKEAFSSVDYKHIRPVEYLPTLRDNSFWYLPDTPVGKLLNECNFTSNERAEGELKEKREETVRMFARLLREDQIRLGDLPEYFNDDDRWDPLNWDYENNRGRNAKVERDKPDMVVVHHTNTASTLTYDDLNALGLLRLYVPEYLKGFPNYDGKKYPISSGHVYKDRPTFDGYHYLVWPDGRWEQPLKLGYTGFHAGNYPINCRSVGIAIVDDLTEKQPSEGAVARVAEFIRQLTPSIVLGHQDIMINGKAMAVNCPGERTWSLWKPKLLSLAGMTQK